LLLPPLKSILGQEYHKKKRFGEGLETVGFQRVENKKRLASLKNFYQNQQNIIQNPLLCSLRTIPLSTVSFEPQPGTEVAEDSSFGTLKITIPEYDEMPLEQIFKLVRDYIEERVPELKVKAPDENLISDLKSLATDAGQIEEENQTDENDTESENNNGESGDSSSVLFEESHIVDFWNEIAARHEILKLVDSSTIEDTFFGFNREALLTYLKPIVLVDGQHRLKGSLIAGKEKLNEPEVQKEIETRISNGEEASDVEKDILNREVRRLPVSLLMSDEPAEQVFQFVVVNQKATPIGRALLGTIVSTTLSNDEMDLVADRLKNAGIELEESQAITYLARHPDSPFHDLIERGLTGDPTDLLQWNVFSSLISIFRNLQGGKLFGSRNDYASVWHQKCLSSSAIVANFEDAGFKNAFDYWKTLDGPWRSVFIAFWKKIKDFFGSDTDPDKDNYWGKPRTSNLFNKISLTILAADFFKFLVEQKETIDSSDAIPGLVDRWLEDVNPGYFDKDWKLAGVKKDSTGIRKQWAYLWQEYRIGGGQLPDRRLFRQARGE
jgi:hypothetical protein